MASSLPARKRRRAGLAALLALALLFGAPASAAGADRVSLSPAEMRGAATLSLRQGRPAQAERLADALLVRDPGDLEALLIRSRARRDQGRLGAALADARAAWQLADRPAARYGAALVRAQALSSSGRRTMAQLWLRRAVEAAPTEALKAKAIRDFRYVRARNPWSTELSFQIAPSDNVNDGSVHDTISFAGIDGVVLSGAAQALSGLEISGGVATRYRFSESGTHKSEIGLSLYHETYVLSSDAQEQAPEVDGSDFAYSSAALTFGHEVRPEGWSGPLALSVSAGWSRYGGEPYARTLKAGVSRTFAGPRDRLRLSFAATQFTLLPYEDSDDRALSLSADAIWSHRLPAGGALHFALGVRDSRSDRSTLDYTRHSAGIAYTLAQPVFGARATAGVELQRRSYDAYPFEADGRQDDKVTARIDLAFPELDLYGFVPTIGLVHSENRSNVDRQETVETGFTFGFRSAF